MLEKTKRGTRNVWEHNKLYTRETANVTILHKSSLLCTQADISLIMILPLLHGYNKELRFRCKALPILNTLLLCNFFPALKQWP